MKIIFNLIEVVVTLNVNQLTVVGACINSSAKQYKPAMYINCIYTDHVVHMDVYIACVVRDLIVCGLFLCEKAVLA